MKINACSIESKLMPTPKIENQLDFPDTHEVVGFGRARPPSSPRSSQVEIEVVLAPVDQRSWTFAPGLSAESRWIGCGELVRVPIGSRWRNGDPIGQRRVPESFRGGGVVSSVLNEAHEDWPDATPSFPTALTAHSRCFRIGLSGPIKWVIVPVTEMLRAVFGRTSDFLLQLYGGRIDENSVLGRFQVDPDQGHFDEKSSTFHLRCASQPTRAEAMLAALILSDDAFGRSFFGVNQNLTHAAGWKNEQPVVVTTNSPLSVGASISFEGRWLARKSHGKIEKRFLVTRLLSFAVDTRFRILEARFPKTKVDKEAPPEDSVIRYGPIEKVFIRTERDPAPGRPSIEMTVPGAALFPASDVDFRLIPDEPVAIVPSPSLLMENPTDEAVGSTGDKVPGGDSRTRHVRIVTDDQPDTPDPRRGSMAVTAEAIASLVVSDGWQRSYGREPPIENVGDGFRVLLVGLIVGGIEVMICDGGETSKKTRSVGVFRQAGATRFDARHMTSLRRLAADEDAHWFGKTDKASGLGLTVAATRRADDVNVYASRLRDAIRKLVS